MAKRVGLGIVVGFFVGRWCWGSTPSIFQSYLTPPYLSIKGKGSGSPRRMALSLASFCLVLVHSFCVFHASMGIVYSVWMNFGVCESSPSGCIKYDLL